MSKILPPSRLALLAHKISHYVVTAEPGTTLDDIAVPSYWRLYEKLRKNDFILIFFSDNAGWAELRVLETGPGYVKTQIVRDFSVKSADAQTGRGRTKESAALDEDIAARAGADEFTVRYLSDGWALVQKGAKSPIYRAFPDEIAAKRKLVEHLDNLNGAPPA